ncbi:MAG: ABC transporter permease, partial [Rhodospirillales bacterium]|nr:ABC transporter permease [Rhodospirillales bacterium]
MNGPSMKLAFNLARRELRGGLKGFRIFITCLAIGVAAIAGIGTLSESVVAGLAADSQVLLGGDVDLRLQHQPLSETQQRYLKNNSAALARMVEFKAMAEPVTQQTDRRRTLVEVKAVDGLYPMTGVLTLDPPATDLKNMLAYRDGAWGAAVDETIFRKLNLKPGDRVSVGDAVFQLRAAVVVEPDRVATVLSFG